MKKGETTVSSLGISVVALVLFAIFVVAFFPTLKNTYSLFQGENNKDKSVIAFYDRLIEELEKDNVNTNLLFSTNDNRIIIGFGKEQDSYSGDCQGAYHSDLRKPAKCEGKGCICLCDAKVLGREMCNTPQDVCEVYEQDISSNSKCGIFLVSTNVIANLDVSKDENMIKLDILEYNKLRR